MSATTWKDGICESEGCNRETRVIHVDGYGDRCLVCADQLAENTEVNYEALR